MGLAATGSGVNLKYREKAGVTFANLSPDGSLTPGPAALTEDCILQNALGGWLWTDGRGLVRDAGAGAEYADIWAESGPFSPPPRCGPRSWAMGSTPYPTAAPRACSAPRRRRTRSRRSG